MDDKIIMNTALTLTKSACDIFMHAAIESSTPKIKTAFQDALDKYLTMQGEIFKDMESAGLYTIENVQETKIKNTANKYDCTLEK